MTALPITNFCIARYDYITVFVTAAVSTDAVVVAFEKSAGITEACAGPLTETGMRISKAMSHALTEALVRFDNYLLSMWGVTRGWSRGNPAIAKRHRPSFFIYSLYGGDHWNEWIP